VYRALGKGEGLFVVAGGAQSGKTTLLYTLLDMVRTPHKSTASVEDPIEYQLEGVTQTRVNTDVGIDMAAGFRNVVHADADTIMVSDVGASSGLIDLVLTQTSKLHKHVIGGFTARGAAHALYELSHAAEQDELLVNGTLSLIVATRLVRALGREKQPYFLTDEEVGELSKYADLGKVFDALCADGMIADDTTTWSTIPFYKAIDDAYAGHLGLHEVLPISLTMKECVLKHATVKDIDARARKEGMLSFVEDGIYKAACGLTTLAEVYSLVR